MTNYLVSNEKTYLFSYNHGGATWTLEVQAKNMEDAKDRVAKMAYATYDGEKICEIPASLGPFAKTAIALRNSLAKIFATSGVS